LTAFYLLPITYYLFEAKVGSDAKNFGIEQAKVFCAQKTLAWKPVLQVPLSAGTKTPNHAGNWERGAGNNLLTYYFYSYSL
jgi:hypothetical protein